MRIQESGKTPIIIIGMHRSGTSLLTRMLEKLDFFVGWKKDSNNESMLFKFINDWILIQSGGSWENPEPVKYLIENDNYRELVVNYINQVLQSRHAINYLGFWHFLKYRDIHNFPFVWGWKDPRNTYSLPLWLEIFPQAKFIHVYRHGVDVADSLKRRYERQLSAVKKPQDQFLLDRTYWFRRKRRTGFTKTVRCATLEGGFSLWQSYMEQAHSYVLKYSDRAIEVKYEDFVQAPEQELQKLASFCGLTYRKDDLNSAASLANPDLAYAYRKNRVLTDFAKTGRDKLSCWGYQG